MKKKTENFGNILFAVGNTPIVQLGKMVAPGSAKILAKAEFMNPSGSVKDRIAAHMIDKAEKEGKLKPGGTIVEATAGNTGLAFALLASVKGYKCIFVLTEKFTGEKAEMLKAYGAEVVVTPSNVSNDSPDSWIKTAERIVAETPNCYYVNQFQNPDNVEAHYLYTGPEIWEQTNGEIDYFVAGAGSGGTISGAGRYLKEEAAKRGKEIKVICPDPVGSMYFDAYYKREKGIKSPYRIEGIGNDMIPGTLDFSVIDEVRQVSDRDAFFAARNLVRCEGLFAGGSSGANVHVAMEIAKEVSTDKAIVVILPDAGGRYVSKLFNDSWMRDQGFRHLEQHLHRIRDLLDIKGWNVEFADGDEPISSVASRMSALGVSQMPLRPGPKAQLAMVHEIDLLQGLIAGKCKASDPAHMVSTPMQGVVQVSDSIYTLEPIFKSNTVAMALDNNKIVGIITKIDLVNYLANLD
jgi:cystathionine beta-synthase